MCFKNSSDFLIQFCKYKQLRCLVKELFGSRSPNVTKIKLPFSSCWSCWREEGKQCQSSKSNICILIFYMSFWGEILQMDPTFLFFYSFWVETQSLVSAANSMWVYWHPGVYWRLWICMKVFLLFRTEQTNFPLTLPTVVMGLAGLCSF